MIFVVAPDESTFTMDHVLERVEAAAARAVIRSISYEALFASRTLAKGSYIFSAVDQLTQVEATVIARCCDLLHEKVPGAHILNRPGRTMRRAQLLAHAYRAGINSFRAVPATRPWSTLRFPVFVRSERQHTGALTPLLGSRATLFWWLARLTSTRHRLADLLIVEFCDTAGADGVYHKYSAFKVGGAVIPRYVESGTDWVTKHAQRELSASSVATDIAYARADPHRDWLRRVFTEAHVGYGRIDYGILGDTPQVWEINTCPTIGGPKVDNRPPEEIARTDAIMEPVRHEFYQRFMPALLALDAPVDPAESVPLPVTDAEMRRREREREERRRIDGYVRGIGHVRAAAGRWKRTGGAALRRMASRSKTSDA